MCEAKIDWTKPVEYRAGAHRIPVEVLWYDERFPDDVMITWGGKVAACPARDHLTYLRNTPPPPTEVWVVWQQHGDIVQYFSTYRQQVKGLREGFFQQKVTCEGPIW